MLTPLPQDWPAHYYDGASPTRQDVTVRVQTHGVEILRAPHARIFWPYESLQLSDDTFSSDMVRLAHKGEAHAMLLVRDRRFREALVQSAPAEWSRAIRTTGRGWEWTVLAAVVVLLLCAGVYFWGSRALGAVLASVMPLSWEERMGDAVADALAPAASRCSDPAVTDALNQLVKRLTAAIPDSRYHYQLAVGGAGLNAFAAPGGRMVVTPALLAMTDRPEQLAGVLAHEIQHVEHRHATQAIFREMSGALILASLTGDLSGSVALQSAASLASLSHSRADEEQADREGFLLLRRAGVDVRGMIEMFRKFEKEEGNLPGGLQYFSTHPMTGDRVRALEGMASGVGGGEALRGVDWGTVKRACQ